MALAAGSKLGPYEIVAPIGAGGMGEVYRAHDTNLKRDVALKVLPSVFAGDAERMARFQREAEVLASLNHPNIAHIYGVEERALVMEMVEGEAPRGPLAFDEAWQIASQIALALEYAHERNIIHRDLKPANVKITPDGTVKLLDFGLAKAFTGPSTETGNPENSPTLTLGATQLGVILGTAAYMAPEQAKGKIVGKRADIWSFGVVLYELLTGERLFTGEDVSDTLAQVLTKQPSLERVPFQARRLLSACLERDPKRRLRDIGDASRLVEEGSVVQTPAAVEVPAPRPPVWKLVLPVVGAVILASGLTWLAVRYLRPAVSPVITRFTVPLPEGQQFTTRNRLGLAISPDGTEMVYVANRRFYVRSIGDLEARPIAGSDLNGNITIPVFSPDGKWLAFHESSDNTIKKLALSGGAAVTICPAEVPVGLTWGPDGLVFAQATRGILRVSANGGSPQLVVKIKDGELIQGSELLPGGRTVLFALGGGAAWDKAKIVAQDLKSGARKTLIEGGSDPRYLPAGHLVYALGGILYTVPFDAHRLEVTGGPIGIVEGVERGGSGAAHFAFSATGALIYVPGPVSSAGSGGQDTLALIDRKGMAEPLKIATGSYDYPRASRDGKRIAYEADDDKAPSIWTYDLSGANSANRLTLNGANRYPIWSANGERVAFQSDREGDLGIWWQRADGTGAPERLTKPENGIAHIPDSFSPDGQTLSYTEVKDTVEVVWTLSLRDKKATVFAQASSSRLGRSAFSPDGHWIAYQTVSSGGGVEVYVKSFPPTAATYQISREEAGHLPVWSSDGKNLIYEGNQGVLTTVSITTKPSFAHGSPTSVPPPFRMHRSNQVRPFDMLPDGRFVAVSIGSNTGTLTAPVGRIQVVLNWFEDVRQRAPER